MDRNTKSFRSERKAPATRIAIPAFLLVSLALGLADMFVPEVFPFAGWGMFAKVPSEKKLYTLIFRDIPDQSLDYPVKMNEAPHLLRSRLNPILLKMLKNWGKAVEEGRASDAAARRRLVEARLLRPGTTYDLVVETNDVIERWRSGTGETEVLLSGLVAGEPAS